MTTPYFLFLISITARQLHHLSYHQEQIDKVAEELKVEKVLPLIITGTVKEDPAGRMEVGWRMRTSPLTFFDEEAGYCEARTSVYRLEGSNGSDVMPDMGDLVLTITY